MPIATSFDFEPLLDGNVLIEFFGDDGMTINTQIVTAEVICRIPVVVALMDGAMRVGLDAAREIMARLNMARSKCRST